MNGLSRIMYIYRSSVNLIKLTRGFMKFPYFYPCGGGNTWAGSIRGVSIDSEQTNELVVSDSLPFCSQRGEHNIFSLPPPPLSLSLSLCWNEDAAALMCLRIQLIDGRFRDDVKKVEIDKLRRFLLCGYLLYFFTTSRGSLENPRNSGIRP